jgi:Innexin
MSAAKRVRRPISVLWALSTTERYLASDKSDKCATISYYQWIPMILLVQALLFYMLIFVWRTLNRLAGVDVGSII